ncbi:MAG TPA: hypothetical protein VEC15_01100 [Actinomycetota bacterium]|nr:hypothetical protein [Actinomycetota bacterium]
MSGTPRVVHADAEPNGLADLLGRLLEGNLAADPTRAKLLVGTTVAIRAVDADVAVVLELSPRAIVIRREAAIAPKCDLAIEATSADLLAMTAAPLALGLPDPRTPSGREILVKIARGQIRIRGLIRSPVLTTRVARLLSVAVDGDR